MAIWLFVCIYKYHMGENVLIFSIWKNILSMEGLGIDQHCMAHDEFSLFATGCSLPFSLPLELFVISFLRLIFV